VMASGTNLSTMRAKVSSQDFCKVNSLRDRA
jgi:hypothetical protein